MKFEQIPKIGALDLETFPYDSEETPYCFAWVLENDKWIGYIDEHDDLINTGIKKLFDCVDSKAIIFIHNINFDAKLILRRLSKGFKVEILSENGNIYYFSLKKSNKEIELRCSLKISNMGSLDNMGKKLLNINKKEFNHDLINSSTILQYKDEVKKYCERDVEIVYKSMIKLNEMGKRLDCSIFDKQIYTAAGWAYTMYKTQYNDLRIPLKIKKNIAKKIKNSYFGGRCEVFGNPKPEEVIHYFDFNSMYPTSMLQEYPIVEGFEGYGGDIDLPGFYEIIYDSDMIYPILPKRCYKTGRLLFANGKKLRGIFWYEEILLFLEQGGKVKSIHWTYKFKKTGFPFEKYVNTFQKIKNESENLKPLAKLLLVSLYGRFGMNPRTENEAVSDEKPEVHSMRCGNYYIYNIASGSKGKQNNIIYAAITTSKARIRLYKAYLEIQKNNGRLLYSDTDSIFSSFPDDKGGQNMGEVEYKGRYLIKDAVFCQPKTYGVVWTDGEEEVHCKGVKARSILFNEMKTCFYSNKKYYKNNELQFKTKSWIIRRTLLSKTISLDVYTKRKFTKDKRDTLPLNL